MALAGLKKQFNKANQYMSEKIGGAEGTKFTDDFTTLERKTDLTNELVEELLNKTKEYLQPNPASRTKLMVSSKLKGAPGKPHAYPQPEGLLADAMCKYGKDLGEDPNYSLYLARTLIEMGEALHEMAEVKYALEDNVKQNFLEPLTHLQAKDLKDVLFHRKKLEGRRLDFDCKKRKKTKGTHITEDEIRMAEEKFEESFNMASQGMHNLLQNEIEQLSQVCVLSEALYEYHSQCANILESLNSRLVEIKNEAAQRPYQAYVPKKLQDLNLVVPGLGGNDDLSPGDGAGNGLNGSIFYNSSDYHRNKHASHSSSQQLHTNSKYTKHRAHQVSSTSDRLHYQVPTISSSASSSPRSIHSIGSYNGQVAAGTGLSSNTAFLLNSTANKPQSSNMQTMNGLNHSKSVSNLHSSVRSNGFDGNGAWDDYDKTSQNNRNSYNSNFDLLGDLDTFDAHFSSHSNHTDRPSTTTAKAGVTSTSARTPNDRGPCALALYDFDAENENELSFKEGDTIQLVSQIDENWYEGTVNGRAGLFPVAYVQVVVPFGK